MALTDEKALIEATLRGDLTAFEQLVCRYQASLVVSACHLLRQADDAEDLAQEALVEAFTRLRTLREPEKFKGWLFTILRNRCLNYLQRHHRELPLDAYSEILAAPDAMEDGEVAELLNRLPFEDREMLAARYLHGLDYFALQRDWDYDILRRVREREDANTRQATR